MQNLVSNPVKNRLGAICDQMRDAEAAHREAVKAMHEANLRQRVLRMEACEQIHGFRYGDTVRVQGCDDKCIVVDCDFDADALEVRFISIQSLHRNGNPKKLFRAHHSEVTR